MIPEDVKALAHRVLRHRVVLTFEADALEIRSEQVIDAIIAAIPSPVGAVGWPPSSPGSSHACSSTRTGVPRTCSRASTPPSPPGRSLDFDDLREYVAGDEVDDIDWKATARTGAPLVKRYKQTRRQDVILAVDTGRGMAAAAEGGGAKREVAILIAGALGYLSLRHGDAVGLVTRSGGRMRHRPPRSSEAYLETLLRTVEQETRLDSDPSDPFALVSYLLRGVPNRSIVIVVGDDVEPAPDIDEALRGLREKHELLWITVADLDLIDGDGTGARHPRRRGRQPHPDHPARRPQAGRGLREAQRRAHRGAARLLPRSRGLALPGDRRRRGRADAAAAAAASPQGGVLSRCPTSTTSSRRSATTGGGGSCCRCSSRCWSPGSC